MLTPPGSGRSKGPDIDWRKVTTGALAKRLGVGLVQPVIYRGKLVGIRRKPDNSALFRLLRRGDALGLGATREGLEP